MSSTVMFRSTSTNLTVDGEDLLAVDGGDLPEGITSSWTASGCTGSGNKGGNRRACEVFKALLPSSLPLPSPAASAVLPTLVPTASGMSFSKAARRAARMAEGLSGGGGDGGTAKDGAASPAAANQRSKAERTLTGSPAAPSTSSSAGRLSTGEPVLSTTMRVGSSWTPYCLTMPSRQTRQLNSMESHSPCSLPKKTVHSKSVLSAETKIISAGRPAACMDS
mmetsp:Transcript_587/g.1471  ORF Transcript_587/g.1471 Transcript_587/m.1471 type:complete len:222 (-) Transcript_587:247-912(-)